LISFDGTPGIVARGWSGAIASGIRVIRNIKPEILKEFLFYYLQTSEPQKVIKFYTTGVTILHASRAIPHIKIPIPPLKIQQKIVERLDAIKKAQELNDKQIELTEELFQSLLHRELDPKGKNWEVKRLGDIGVFKRGSFGGSLKKEIFVESGYKVYEQKNVIYNDFTLGNYFIDEKKI
jgi:type I restriction enzyme S subunit